MEALILVLPLAPHLLALLLPVHPHHPAVLRHPVARLRVARLRVAHRLQVHRQAHLPLALVVALAHRVLVASRTVRPTSVNG